MAIQQEKIHNSILIALSVFLVLFTVLSFLVAQNAIGPLDDAIIQIILLWISPSLTTIMKAFTFIGSVKIVTPLSMLVLFVLYRVVRHLKELYLFVAVIVGTELSNLLVKYAFHRERPTLHRLIDETGFAYPSGHSMVAFSFYGCLAYLIWRHTKRFSYRLGIIFFSVFMILAIGISRIYLGVHYPSDVLGAYLAGGAWLFLTIAYFERYVLPNRSDVKKATQ